MENIFKRRRNHGFSMALTLIVMSLICVIGFGMISIITSQSRTASSLSISSTSYGLAMFGINNAMSNLKSDATWSGTSTTNVSMARFSGGTYQTTVTGYYVNPTTTEKLWKIISTGTVGDNKRIVTALVTSDTFAKYAYFTDYEYGYWVTANTFDGPVHTNGCFTYSGNPKYKYETTCANRKRYDGYDNTAAPAIDGTWTLDLSVDPNSNPKKPYYYFQKQYNLSTWFTIYDPSKTHFYCPKNSTSSTFSTWSDGPAAMTDSSGNAYSTYSFSCAKDKISLPNNTSWIEGVADVKVNPRSTPTAAASTNTYTLVCYIDTSDGNKCKYYILNSSGNKITDATSDPELKTSSGSTDVTIHINGVVTLKARDANTPFTTKGRVTIAASNNITIRNNILIDGTTKGDTPSSSSTNMLGIVGGGNVSVLSDEATSLTHTHGGSTHTHTGTGDEYIYASILAMNGAFQGSDYSTRGAKADGTQSNMYLYGGNIAKSAGYFATSGGAGYIEHYIYDTRFLTRCPKNFPITGNLKILALYDSAALSR